MRSTLILSSDPHSILHFAWQLSCNFLTRVLRCRCRRRRTRFRSQYPVNTHLNGKQQCIFFFLSKLPCFSMPLLCSVVSSEKIESMRQRAQNSVKCLKYTTKNSTLECDNVQNHTKQFMKFYNIKFFCDCLKSIQMDDLFE